MSWNLDFSNLGPLHQKAKPVGYKGPLQGNYTPVDKAKEKQINDYMSSQKKEQVGKEWGGDFTNLGPLAVRVKPSYFAIPKGKGKKK